MWTEVHFGFWVYIVGSHYWQQYMMPWTKCHGLMLHASNSNICKLFLDCMIEISFFFWPEIDIFELLTLLYIVRLRRWLWAKLFSQFIFCGGTAPSRQVSHVGRSLHLCSCPHIELFIFLLLFRKWEGALCFQPSQIAVVLFTHKNIAIIYTLPCFFFSLRRDNCNYLERNCSLKLNKEKVM